MDDEGILKCGIEQAYLAGKTDYKKTISCHMYPIRVKKYDVLMALNYDRGISVNPACPNWGQSLKVPNLQFLQGRPTTKYGEALGNGELVTEIEG